MVDVPTEVYELVPLASYTVTKALRSRNNLLDKSALTSPIIDEVDFGLTKISRGSGGPGTFTPRRTTFLASAISTIQYVCLDLMLFPLLYSLFHFSFYHTQSNPSGQGLESFPSPNLHPKVSMNRETSSTLSLGIESSTSF